VTDNKISPPLHPQPIQNINQNAPLYPLLDYNAPPINAVNPYQYNMQYPVPYPENKEPIVNSSQYQQPNPVQPPQPKDPKFILIEEVVSKLKKYNFIKEGVSKANSITSSSAFISKKTMEYESILSGVNAKIEEMAVLKASMQSAINSWDSEREKAKSQNSALSDESLHLMKWSSFLLCSPDYNYFLKKMFENKKMSVDQYLRIVRAHSAKMFRKIVLIKKIINAK
jgi:hypothetical protein